MSAHNIKILAIDLDGTLTNDNKDITPLTHQALMQAQEHGVRVCLASGRPPYGMYPLAEQLRIREHGGLLLCYSGGHIEDYATGEVLVEQALDEALLPHLYEAQERSGLTLMTYFGDSIYTEHPDNPYVRISQKANKMQIRQVNNFLEEVPRPINKCLLVGDPAVVPQWETTLSAEMQGRMHVVRSMPYYIELLPLGIDKGPSLSMLMEREGLTMSNLMAFGDGNNDISMLRMAGIGVAMSNAEEGVKAVADYVTLSNNNDGVAHALQHFGII